MPPAWPRSRHPPPRCAAPPATATVGPRTVGRLLPLRGVCVAGDGRETPGGGGAARRAGAPRRIIQAPPSFVHSRCVVRTPQLPPRLCSSPLAHISPTRVHRTTVPRLARRSRALLGRLHDRRRAPPLLAAFIVRLFPASDIHPSHPGHRCYPTMARLGRRLRATIALVVAAAAVAVGSPPGGGGGGVAAHSSTLRPLESTWSNACRVGGINGAWKNCPGPCPRDPDRKSYRVEEFRRGHWFPLIYYKNNHSGMLGGGAQGRRWRGCGCCPFLRCMRGGGWAALRRPS